MAITFPFGTESKRSWYVPLADGMRLEIIRDWVSFGEDRAGEREMRKKVLCTQKVVAAEVSLSGFNTWYTREGHDHEVMQYRVDAWVRGWDDKNLGVTEEEFTPKHELERQVRLRFMYALTDEDVSDDDDFNNGAIGFTVMALTVPQ